MYISTAARFAHSVDRPRAQAEEYTMAATTTAQDSKADRNLTYLAGKLIVKGFMIGALAASYTHIVHLLNMLGLTGWQAFVAPAFIDGFALLGMLGRSPKFAAETRRVGFRMQVTASALSLIANVAAGQSWGARIFGVMVVAGYVVAEWYGEKLIPSVVDTEAQEIAEADALSAKRSAAAQKAAATRKANAEIQAAAKRATAAARKARPKAVTVAEAIPATRYV
jgi:hypothetical protein